MTRWSLDAPLSAGHDGEVIHLFPDRPLAARVPLTFVQGHCRAWPGNRSCKEARLAGQAGGVTGEAKINLMGTLRPPAESGQRENTWRSAPTTW